MIEALGASSDPARALLVGSSADERRAHALGLASVNRVVAPVGSAALAWRGVRRWLRALSAHEALVTAWSIGALAASCLAAPRSRVSLTLSVPPESPGERRLAAVFAPRADRVSFASASARDAWTQSLPGLRPFADAPLQRPTAPDSIRGLWSRAEVRRGWGVSGKDRVVVALGDAPHLCDAREFVARLGVMGVGGFRVVGVVPSSARHLERALRFTRRHPGAWRLLVDDAPEPAVLAGCDLAMPAAVHAEAACRRAAALGVRVVPLREAVSGGLESHAALMRALDLVPASGA